MLFVYECTGNIIAEFKKFYDTQLSEEQKKRIFVPTYDCMKKYQGSWHMEQKPAFRNCFLIECRDRDDLADMLHRLQCADILAENITANAIALFPEQEVFLRNLMMPETKKISMSTGYIKDGRTYVTKGPLQGREKMISRIDRHKRLAKLRFAAGNTDRELCAGLEIISKS
jgi:transcriptional antiterminator NusG